MIARVVSKYSAKLLSPIAMLCLLLCVALAPACFESPEPGAVGEAVAIPAAVLYRFGKVTADGVALKAGDIAAGGALVQTGRKSLGNLQLQSSEARVVFLMRENAELKLVALRREKVTDVTPILRRGRVMVRVEKLSGAERMFVYTPDARVSVQGTELIVEAGGDGESKVQVHSGLVRVRPRLAALEDLPPAVLERSRAAGEIAGALDSLGIVVVPGEEARVSRARTEAALALLPGLNEKLNRLSREMREGTQAGRSPEELARSLDEGLEESARELRRRVDTAKAAAAEGEAAGESIAPLRTTEIPTEEREVMGREFKAIVSVSREVVNDSERLASAIATEPETVPFQEVEQQNSQKKSQQESTPQSSQQKQPAPSEEEQLQSLAGNLGGSVKVLVLQNGEEKRGVVVNQGEDYLFATPAGQKVYKREEVREVRLR